MPSEEWSAESRELWGDAPLPSLIDHVVTTYHRPLQEELPQVDSLCRAVLDAHGDECHELLSEVQSVFTALRFELEDHMAKEEEVLFPMIRRGQGAMADGPIAMMEQEHRSAIATLERLRELTEGHEPPADASDDWRALWRRLRVLGETMGRHIALEDEILFPRALAS